MPDAAPSSFSRRGVLLIALLLALIPALTLRLPELDKRPMHTDEAVHGVKLGELLEEGRYVYDPQDYHGPTLYYFTFPLIWLNGDGSLRDLDETTLRLVPVIFSVALILLLLLVADGASATALTVAALLTALSPAMVFYSRYYIQEMLLVFFTFLAIGCGWRYCRRPGWLWAVFFGASMGLMYATKETCVLAWSAMAIAVFAVLWWGRRATRAGSFEGPDLRRFTRHFLVSTAVGLVIAAFILSDFWEQPSAIVDSFLSYWSYLDRSGGAGMHDQPWYAYLRILLYYKNAPGPVWSEALIVALALVGAVVVIQGKGRMVHPGLGRFLLLYTVLLTAIYSAIPYKTPWCALNFLHGLILLGGIGGGWLLSVPPRWGRVLAGLILVAVCLNLYQQATRSVFLYDADTRNPYVYGHSSRDVVKLSDRIHRVAALHPDGNEMLVKVIAPEYWPLPWYLRDMQHVGYWAESPENAHAPVVVTTPEFEKNLPLDEGYQAQFFSLRPEVLLRLHIRRDLWDAMLEPAEQAR